MTENKRFTLDIFPEDSPYDDVLNDNLNGDAFGFTKEYHQSICNKLNELFEENEQLKSELHKQSKKCTESVKKAQMEVDLIKLTNQQAIEFIYEGMSEMHDGKRDYAETLFQKAIRELHFWTENKRFTTWGNRIKRDGTLLNIEFNSKMDAKLCCKLFNKMDKDQQEYIDKLNEVYKWYEEYYGETILDTRMWWNND